MDNNDQTSIELMDRSAYNCDTEVVILDNLNFNKLILGDSELNKFERLLITDGYCIEDIESCDLVPFKKKSKSHTRLLTSLMLYEKIDAVTLSSLNLSPLIDAGVVEPESCIVAGTSSNHPLERMIGVAWEYKQNIISTIYVVLDDLLNHFNLKHEFYPQNILDDEDLLQLVDSILYGTKLDFVTEFERLVRHLLDPYEIGHFEDTIERAGALIDQKAELLLTQFRKVSSSDPLLYEEYCHFFPGMQERNQRYTVPCDCRTCEKNWRDCIKNSEFLSQHAFSCPQREDLGSQKLAKVNGLITSHLQKATLFDDSIRFKTKQVPLKQITEEIYHIVNIDMSRIVGSLPEPFTIQEAMRLRERPEIKSYRSIFLSWCENMYRGNVQEAEYIKRDFDDANKFFKDKEKREKNSPIFHVTCEIIGNQIPYLSNVVGVVSPLRNLKNNRLEEKYRWILLTR